MKLKILYKKVATKFLYKNNSLISKEKVEELIIKAMLHILKKEDVNIDLSKMFDSEKELFRIRKGDIRIIFSYSKDGNIFISLIEKIGFRGNVYKK